LGTKKKKIRGGPDQGRIGGGGGCGTTGMSFLAKTSITERHVTRGIVVTEHPIVRNAWSQANDSFS